MAGIYDVTVHEINVWNRSVVADSKEEACALIEDTIANEGFEYCTLTTDRIKSRAKQLPVLTYDQYLKEYHDRAVDLFNYVKENGYECWVTTHIMLGIAMLEKAYPQYYVQIKGTRILGHKCWDLIDQCRPRELEKPVAKEKTP